MEIDSGSEKLHIRLSDKEPHSATPVNRSGLALDYVGGVRLAIKPFNASPITLDPEGYVTVAVGPSITPYGVGGNALDVNPIGLYEKEYDYNDNGYVVSYDLDGASTLPSGQYIPLTVTISGGGGDNLPLMTRFLLTTETGVPANRLDYRVESVNYQSKTTIVVKFGIRFVGDDVTTDYPLSNTVFKLVPYSMVARGPEGD